MDDPNPMTVDEFKAALAERGINSQTAAAYRLGYSQSGISLMLRGKRTIPARMRILLAGIRRKRQQVGDEQEPETTLKQS